MKNIKLKIKGMHCTSCSTRLERVLNNLDGVEATVNLEAEMADIKYVESKITLEEIKEAITDCGFEVEGE